MRKRSQRKISNEGGRPTRSLLMVTVVILVISTVTVVSRQRLSNARVNHSVGGTSANANDSKVAGRGASVYSQNTQKDLSADEEAKLGAGLSQVINQSTDGLVEVQHGDGSVSLNLQDRFQSVSVARVDQRGNLSQSCVDNPAAAGAFFGIDPKLIEKQPRTAHPVTQELK